MTTTEDRAIDYFLDCTDFVFTHSDSKVVAEGRQVAFRLFQELKQSRINVRSYVAIAMLFSSLAGLRRRFGPDVTRQYCDAMIKALQHWCLTLSEDDGTSDTTSYRRSSPANEP